jgi:hypothetical protein
MTIDARAKPGRYAWVLAHLVGGATFLVLPVFFAPGPDPNWQNVFSPFALSKWLGRGLMLVVFYIHLYQVVPRYFLAQRYGWYLLWVVVGFGLVYGLSQAWLHSQSAPLLLPRGGAWTLGRMGPDLYLYLLVVAGALLLRLRQHWQQAEQAKLAAELNYLRAQVNPHFLFNSLNTIYSLALDKSDAAPGAIAMLAGLMRYTLAEVDRPTVPLAIEVEHLQNYIGLQQLRLGGGTQVQARFSGDFAALDIAPVLLIGLVENAFKHGASPEEAGQIGIELRADQGQLHFEVRNKLLANPPLATEGLGLGLPNTRRRLQLAYPGRHTLLAGPADGFFAVHLTIVAAG